tara:strand:- start:1310 stop:2161 length:852 start_codon:yes stop_codon:yes gene_type:complete
MNTTTLLISLLLLVTLGHNYLFSKRVSEYWIAPLFNNPYNNPDFNLVEIIRKIKNRTIIMGGTVIFGLGPLLIYNLIRNLPFENLILRNVFTAIILIISIATLWFSASKMNPKSFGHKIIVRNTKDTKINTNSISNIVKTKNLKEKKLSTSQIEENKNLALQYRHFLKKVENFELFNKTNRYFELGGYKLKDKGRNITPAQACYILTFFWRHEVLKTDGKSENFPEFLWKYWNSELKISTKVTKPNWQRFKINHLFERSEEVKETEFYILFRNFYYKNSPQNN